MLETHNRQSQGTAAVVAAVVRTGEDALLVMLANMSVQTECSEGIVVACYYTLGQNHDMQILAQVTLLWEE
jgi:hypothetical protein